MKNKCLLRANHLIQRFSTMANHSNSRSKHTKIIWVPKTKRKWWLVALFFPKSHMRSLTVRPWKFTIPKGEDHLPFPSFFRGKLAVKTSGLYDLMVRDSRCTQHIPPFPNLPSLVWNKIMIPKWGGTVGWLVGWSIHNGVGWLVGWSKVDV